jgi:SAM-dependent methyltransferase
MTEISNPFFSRVWTVMSAHETEELTNLRRENLAGLTGRVLEVGAGTGTNFAHYPPEVTQVVAVEPEALLLRHAQRAAATAPVPVTVTGQAVEDLGTDTEPFDAVVCSLVLCTVADQGSVLRQLYGVLRPGGQLRYLEHVASPGWRGGLQRVADATVWPRLFGGCHTHRETERGLTDAGFSIDVARHQWTMPRWLPVPVAEFALGRAVRPA